MVTTNTIRPTFSNQDAFKKRASAPPAPPRATTQRCEVWRNRSFPSIFLKRCQNNASERQKYGPGNHGPGKGAAVCRRTAALQYRPGDPDEPVARAVRGAGGHLA